MSSSRSFIKTFYAIGDTDAVLNPAVVSGDMSDDIIGPSTELGKIDQVAYSVRWTSSDAVGTIAVEGSIDGVKWDALTFDPELEQPTSNNNSYLINLALIPFSFIRLTYTRDSGSGDLVVTMSAKGN